MARISIANLTDNKQIMLMVVVTAILLFVLEAFAHYKTHEELKRVREELDNAHELLDMCSSTVLR